jgi:hypothetical protein
MSEIFLRGNSSVSDNVFDSHIIKNDHLKLIHNKVNDIVASGFPFILP